MSARSQLWRLIITEPHSGRETVMLFDDWSNASCVAQVWRLAGNSAELLSGHVTWRAAR